MGPRDAWRAAARLCARDDARVPRRTGCDRCAGGSDKRPGWHRCQSPRPRRRPRVGLRRVQALPHIEDDGCGGVRGRRRRLYCEAACYANDGSVDFQRISSATGRLRAGAWWTCSSSPLEHPLLGDAGRAAEVKRLTACHGGSFFPMLSTSAGPPRPFRILRRRRPAHWAMCAWTYAWTHAGAAAGPAPGPTPSPAAGPTRKTGMLPGRDRRK